MEVRKINELISDKIVTGEWVQADFIQHRRERSGHYNATSTDIFEKIIDGDGREFKVKMNQSSAVIAYGRFKAGELSFADSPVMAVTEVKGAGVANTPRTRSVSHPELKEIIDLDTGKLLIYQGRFYMEDGRPDILLEFRIQVKPYPKNNGWGIEGSMFRLSYISEDPSQISRRKQLKARYVSGERTPKNLDEAISDVQEIFRMNFERMAGLDELIDGTSENGRPYAYSKSNKNIRLLLELGLSSGKLQVNHKGHLVTAPLERAKIKGLLQKHQKAVLSAFARLLDPNTQIPQSALEIDDVHMTEKRIIVETRSEISSRTHQSLGHTLIVMNYFDRESLKLEKTEHAFVQTQKEAGPGELLRNAAPALTATQKKVIAQNTYFETSHVESGAVQGFDYNVVIKQSKVISKHQGEIIASYQVNSDQVLVLATTYVSGWVDALFIVDLRTGEIRKVNYPEKPRNVR